MCGASWGRRALRTLTSSACLSGAWVAAAIAQRHPELVDKLVLMSPAGLIATQSNMARIRAERTKAVENPTWESIKAMFNNLIADEARRLPDLIGLRQAIYCRKDTLETIDHLLALQDAETRERNLLSPEQWGRDQGPHDGRRFRAGSR